MTDEKNKKGLIIWIAVICIAVILFLSVSLVNVSVLDTTPFENMVIQVNITP